MSRSRIRARITRATARRLAAEAATRGVTRSSLIETALLHLLAPALDEEGAVPSRIVVDAATGRRILERIRRPRRPTKAMRDLFVDDPAE